MNDRMVMTTSEALIFATIQYGYPRLDPTQAPLAAPACATTKTRPLPYLCLFHFPGLLRYTATARSRLVIVASNCNPPVQPHLVPQRRLELHASVPRSASLDADEMPIESP